MRRGALSEAEKVFPSLVVADSHDGTLFDLTIDFIVTQERWRLRPGQISAVLLEAIVSEGKSVMRTARMHRFA